MADDLKIVFQLTDVDAKTLEVRVSAPGGEMRGSAPLPPDSLMDEIGAADPANIPAALVEKTGRALYGALVSETVDELVIDTLNDGRKAKRPVQIELRFDADQWKLARFPWEMIQNAQGEFLVRDWLADLTRYITYPQPPPEFDPAIGGLALFRVLSDPFGLPALSFGPLAIQPIETLDDATFDNFQRKLLIDRTAIWGIEFDGHGALVRQCPSCNTLNGPAEKDCWSCHKPLAGARQLGALAFEKESGVEWVPTDIFGSTLYNSGARLAMLLACETARVGDSTIFSGLAPHLLLAGVPAVIGMQFPVLDTFANQFSNVFYEAFKKDFDLLAALRTARRATIQGAWYSPALYLRRKPETPPAPTSQTRNIDTAAPARVQVGSKFLVRLWVRRPETSPLTPARLRKELDIPADVKVRQTKGEGEVQFAPVEGRKLRQGELEVETFSSQFEVTPEKMKLFVDETHDAPPAIFTVKAAKVGKFALGFRVMQDGGVIYTVSHEIEVVAEAAAAEVATHSAEVGVEGSGGAKVIIPPILSPSPKPATSGAPGGPGAPAAEPAPVPQQGPLPPPPQGQHAKPPEHPEPPKMAEEAEAPPEKSVRPPQTEQETAADEITQTIHDHIPTQRPAPHVKGGSTLRTMVGVVVAGGLVMAVVLGGYLLFGSSFGAATPTPTVTASPSSAPTDTPTPADTPTPTITPTPDITGPDAPKITGPEPRMAVKECPAQIDLTWDPATDPSGIKTYQVDVQMLNDNQEWQYVQQGSLVTDPTLPVTLPCAEGKVTQYRWRVRAIDGAENASPWAPSPEEFASLSVYLPDTTPPPAPLLITPKDATQLVCATYTADLSWTAVVDASGINHYQVEVSTVDQNGQHPFNVFEITETSIRISLQPYFCGGDFQWRVRAYDGAGNTGIWSAYQTFSTNSPPG